MLGLCKRSYSSRKPGTRFGELELYCSWCSTLPAFSERPSSFVRTSQGRCECSAPCTTNEQAKSCSKKTISEWGKETVPTPQRVFWRSAALETRSSLLPPPSAHRSSHVAVVRNNDDGQSAARPCCTMNPLTHFLPVFCSNLRCIFIFIGLLGFIHSSLAQPASLPFKDCTSGDAYGPSQRINITTVYGQIVPNDDFGKQLNLVAFGDAGQEILPISNDTGLLCA